MLKLKIIVKLEVGSKAELSLEVKQEAGANQS
jgi:hypothetical protein